MLQRYKIMGLHTFIGRIERCSPKLSIAKNFLFACIPLFGVVGWGHLRMQSAVELHPRYTEEPHEFALRHGNASISFSDNMHIVSPIKITALIGYACFSFVSIDCFHTVSSFLSFELTTNGIVLVFVTASISAFAIFCP